MPLLLYVPFSIVGILIVDGIIAVPTVEVIVLFDVIYALIFQYFEPDIFGHIPTSFHDELKLISMSCSDQKIIQSLFLKHKFYPRSCIPAHT